MNEHFEAMLFGLLAEIPYLPGAGANAENVVNTATQADGSKRVSFSLRNLFRKGGEASAAPIDQRTKHLVRALDNVGNATGSC